MPPSHDIYIKLISWSFLIIIYRLEPVSMLYMLCIQQKMEKMFRPLAVIPLSATHSEILKNILIKYQIYPEILFVIEGWVGFEWIFKIHFSRWAYVKKFAFLFLVFWIIFRFFSSFSLIWEHYWLQLGQFSAQLSKWNVVFYYLRRFYVFSM